MLKREKWMEFQKFRNLGFGSKPGHEGCSGITGIIFLYETDCRVDQEQSYDSDKVLPIWRLPLINNKFKKWQTKELIEFEKKDYIKISSCSNDFFLSYLANSRFPSYYNNAVKTSKWFKKTVTFLVNEQQNIIWIMQNWKGPQQV